jgi:hypothetical protein
MDKSLLKCKCNTLFKSVSIVFFKIYWRPESIAGIWFHHIKRPHTPVAVNNETVFNSRQNKLYVELFACKSNMHASYLNNLHPNTLNVCASEYY